jgi:hypothetical protein
VSVSLWCVPVSMGVRVRACARRRSRVCACVGGCSWARMTCSRQPTTLSLLSCHVRPPSATKKRQGNAPYPLCHCTGIHTHSHTHTHTHSHTYKHTYIHTYTDTHTHTHRKKWRPPRLTGLSERRPSACGCVRRGRWRVGAGLGAYVPLCVSVCATLSFCRAHGCTHTRTLTACGRGCADGRTCLCRVRLCTAASRTRLPPAAAAPRRASTRTGGRCMCAPRPPAKTNLPRASSVCNSSCMRVLHSPHAVR